MDNIFRELIKNSDEVKSQFEKLKNLDLNESIDFANHIIKAIIEGKFNFLHNDEINKLLTEINSEDNKFVKYMLTEKLDYLRDPDLGIKAKNIVTSMYNEYLEKEEYFHNHLSSITSTNNSFNYNIKLVESKNSKINDIFECFNILKERLDLKKINKYNNNIVMLHDFISNLNDCFAYLNNALIKLRIADSSETISNELYGANEKNGENGNRNDVNRFLNWLEYIESREKEKNNLREVKIYFHVFAMLIRNYYSHGWLDIFKTIALNYEIPNMYLSYNIIDKKDYYICGNKITVKEADMILNIWDAEVILEDLFYLENKSTLDKLKTEEDGLEHLKKYGFGQYNYEQLVFSKEKSRALLRKLSTNKIENIEFKNYPQKIIIFSDDKNYNNIEISEEDFFQKLNCLISLIEQMIEKEILKLK